MPEKTKRRLRRSDGTPEGGIIMGYKLTKWAQSVEQPRLTKRTRRSRQYV